MTKIYFQGFIKSFSNNFFAYIRQINSALAFASMKANLDPIMNCPGPYVFKISNSICHYTPKECTMDKKSMKYSQLYFLSTSEATAHRLSVPYNKELNAEVNSKKF